MSRLESKALMDKCDGDVLGIIAGSGRLPLEIAEIYSSCGKQCYIAALDPQSNFNRSDHFTIKNFQVGQVGGIIEFFKGAGVANLIMIGKIDRPDLKSIKVDLEGAKLLASIMKRSILGSDQVFGDDYILKLVSEFLERHKFRVLSPIELLKFTNYKDNLVAVNCPSAQDSLDISLGVKVLKATGDLDIGQALIVCDGYILGLEAAEGTDNLIKRCGILKKRKKGGVLVKMSKSAQDMRLDIPTIGPDTIFSLAENGFSGVAIEKEKVIIVDAEETQKLAAMYRIFLAFV